jgi:hypothetical protein
MKNPADKGLESVAIIFPLKLAILKDLIAFIPAGAEAPGMRTTDIITLDKVHNQYLNWL